MGSLFVYILKSSICLTIFYLFYKLLLSRETFHKFNRFALLSSLFLAFILPLFELPLKTNIKINSVSLLLDSFDIPARPQINSPEFSWVYLIVLIYISGFALFILRDIFSIVQLVCLIRKSKSRKIGNGIILIIHNKDIMPFSWLRYIVISETDFAKNDKYIMLHEIAHIRKYHSLDLFIAELCNTVQWFNPAAWFFLSELKKNHEYQADEDVINKGVNSKLYQLLLIQKAVGGKLFAIANNFSHSKLKNRIIMMKKQKSRSYKRLKYLYIMPLTALALTAFANEKVESKMKQIGEADLGNLISVLSSTSKSIVTSDTTNNTVQKLVKAKKTAEEKNIDKNKIDTFSMQFVHNADSVGNNVGTTLNVISIGEKKNIRIIEDGKGKKYYVNGEKVEAGDIEKINPDEINEVCVLKNSFGNSDNVSKEEISHLVISSSPGKKDGKSKMEIVTNENIDNALLIVDGKEYKRSIKNLDKDKENIESISILKGKSAVEMYGDKGKNGVVLVTTKNK